MEAPVSWVTVFNGVRDSYQVPLALAEAGRLERLVTDWYSPLDKPAFRRAAHLLPSRIRTLLGRRYQPGLPSGHVESMLREAIRQRLRPEQIHEVDARMGRRAGEIARDRGAGLFAYSYYAFAAFGSYGRAPGRRLLFQVHPHPATVRSILREEMQRAPEQAGSLNSEHETGAGEKRFEQLCAEPLLADYCVAASQFTKSTLVASGVPAARVRVVPYGVDLHAFVPPEQPPGGRFRVLFAGQMVQRKGLSYLLEAWKRLALPDAELVLAGRGRRDEGLLARYHGRYRLEADASPDRLRKLYQTSDVFCMPSLAEGFGLVYLEALACGTPVIGTPNTGAPDLLSDADAGFIVPVRDVDALADRIRWCYEHRDDLLAMRVRARRQAERFPWAAFRQGVVEFAAQATES